MVEDGDQLGGVSREVTLKRAVALAAPVDSATLVQTIDTSVLTPGSPDPSGVTFLWAESTRDHRLRSRRGDGRG